MIDLHEPLVELLSFLAAFLAAGAIGFRFMALRLVITAVLVSLPAPRG